MDNLTITTVPPNSTWSFGNIPPNAGKWMLNGNLHIYVRDKPTRWQQWWTKRLLGWEWQDEPH